MGPIDVAQDNGRLLHRKDRRRNDTASNFTANPRITMEENFALKLTTLGKHG
jgi:hypothetical protein